MNIIYSIENIDKNTYPNKYIGFKTECGISDIDGLPTIFCMKTGNMYLGSSSNQIMINDLKSGNRFTAKVLEIVKDRKLLVKRESYYLDINDAVNSNEYYNLGDRPLNACLNQDVVGNCFGETLKQRATNERAMSVRDQTSRNLGFENYGELCFYIHKELTKGKSGKDVSDSLKKYRQFSLRFTKDFDMKKATLEMNKALILKSSIRSDRDKEATLEKLKELYGFELPTLRIIIGDYGKDYTYRVATSRNMTGKELDIDITKRVLDGKDFKDVSEETGVQLNTVKRCFLRCVRSQLKSSDL